MNKKWEAHLGLIWDSVTMTGALPEDKIAKIRARAAGMLAAGVCTADALRSLLGTLERTQIVTAQAKKLPNRTLNRSKTQSKYGPKWNGASRYPNLVGKVIICRKN